MKNLITGSALLLAVCIGCTKTSLPESAPVEETAVSMISQRTCASADILAAQLAADPALRSRRQNLEIFTRNNIAKGNDNLAPTSITIPVVVNVLYNTAAENISDAQIRSQIDVLNEDFNKRNADISGVPSIYKSRIGDMGIRFELSEVVRKQSSRKQWAPVDGMKSASAGIAATDPLHKLNMWVCNLGQNLLGYAYYPETAPPDIDGVVVLYSAFGSRAKYPAGTYLNTYDLGRTATHEVGHWMNLVHIWGDDGGSCEGTDLVEDTPNQANLNFGCPAFPLVSCGNSGDMSMNYMDYTDDRCMYMFSKGQQARSLAVFAPGGPRSGYIQ